MSPKRTIEALPEPFRSAEYELLKRGVHDDDATEVYVDREGTFAFLHPRPAVEYAAYRPRVEKLGLGGYKRTLGVVERRYDKVRHLFLDASGVLEIGAGDGSFLAHLAGHHPSLGLACVEVDRNTRAARDAVAGLVQYDSLGQAHAAGARVDLVCAFHVLEHILEPVAFLEQCRACLRGGGRLVFEIPSLDDPLLSLYAPRDYRDFYFQRQHAYVYSARSAVRLLEHCGLHVEQVIPHQRYGLENHLQWLSAGKPGGSETFRALFSSIESEYVRGLEVAGRTDAVILVAGERP